MSISASATIRAAPGGPKRGQSTPEYSSSTSGNPRAETIKP